jgi:hypothetical protein
MTTSHSKKPVHTANPASASPAGGPAAPLAPTASGVGAPVTTLVSAPPPLTLPTIPASFTPLDLRYYSGILPKASQLAVVEGAAQEVRDFADYLAVFGRTAPPQADVAQAFDVAGQWSAGLAKIERLRTYFACGEAQSWQQAHGYMARLQPAFDLAVKAEPTIGAQRPSLSSLFGAQKQIAKKALATKKANQEAIARGEQPTKGKVGKKRKAAAANALYEAATKPTSATNPSGTAGPVAPPTSATAGGNGSSTNGASHS